jgi:hypothetical protein
VQFYAARCEPAQKRLVASHAEVCLWVPYERDESVKRE